MMYWGTGMGGWGTAMMAVSGLLFWGLIIAGIVAAVRYTGRGADRGAEPAASPTRAPTPQQVLADRFARGEIDEQEYRQRAQVLAETATPG
jgi:putative membrane protein